MRKPSATMLQRIADSLDPVAGAARISGLRIRPPIVSQEAYDLSTERGEPNEYSPTPGLVISRPVTDDQACRQMAERQERASGYVEQTAQAPKDLPSWLVRLNATSEVLTANEQELMQRRTIDEWRRENEGN